MPTCSRRRGRGCWRRRSERLRRIILVLLGCAAGLLVFGYWAVRAQGPGTGAARKAASELVDSQGGSAWVAKQLLAQRPAFVQQVVQVTGLADEHARRLMDEVLFPELTSHVAEIREAVQDAWAASFSARDLHTLERCWALLSPQHIAAAGVTDIDACLASHAARKMAVERPLINERVRAAGLAFGLEWFPAALLRHREILRSEGIVVTQATRL